MAENFARAIPPNMLTAFAEKLRGGKEFLNKGNVGIPWTKYKMPIGDLVIGEADNVLENASYGFMPWSGKGQTWTLDPEALDVVGLPTLGAGVLAKTGLRAGGRALTQNATVEALRGRRDFIKKMGAVGITAAAAGSIPDLLRRAVDVPAAAVKTAVRAAVPAKSSIEILDAIGGRLLGSGHELGKRAGKYLEEDGLSTLYDPHQVTSIDHFVSQLPEGFDTELAVRRVLADPTAKPPEFVGLGRQPVPDNLEEEYSYALNMLEGAEVDVWKATGIPPKSLDPKWLKYTDEMEIDEMFGDLSSGDKVGGHSVRQMIDEGLFPEEYAAEMTRRGESFTTLESRMKQHALDAAEDPQWGVEKY